MSAGRDVWTSVTVTANGVAAQFGTLATAKANKVENVIVKQLIGHLKCDNAAARTLNFGLSIQLAGAGTPVNILSGSVTGDAVGDYFTTSSSGTDQQNVFALTRDASGLILAKINLTAGFFGTTAATPVPYIGAKNVANPPTGISDALWDSNAGEIYYGDGLVTPIFIENGDVLQAWISTQGTSTFAKFYCKVGLSLISDTQQT